MGTVTTDEQRKMMRQLYVKGLLSCAEIAARIGCTRQTVNTILKKMGVNTSKRKIVVECSNCGVPTEKTRKEYRKHERHFCSIGCYQKHLRKPSVHEEIQRLKVARDRAYDLLPMGWHHGLAVHETEDGDVLVFPAREDLLEWKRTGLFYRPYSINKGDRVKVRYGG